jgi:hypothetical protein
VPAVGTQRGLEHGVAGLQHPTRRGESEQAFVVEVDEQLFVHVVKREPELRSPGLTRPHTASTI